MPATPFLAVCFPNMKHSYEMNDTSVTTVLHNNSPGLQYLDS